MQIIFLPKKILGLLIGLTFMLAACGPKDIGQGEVEDPPQRTSVSNAEQMRYPHFGSDANQRMLFFHNKMDVMYTRQSMLESRLKVGSELSPEHPNYRAVPKEPSPFRQ